MNRRRPIRSAALLLLLVAVLPLAGCERVTARLEVKKGNDAYAAEEYQEALEHYTKALEKDPALDEIGRVIGYCHMALYKAGDESPANLAHVTEAESAFRTYLGKHDNDEKARNALLNTYLNAGRDDDAVKFYLDQLEREPGNIANVRAVATLYAKAGNFPEALKWYERSVEIEPLNPQAHYILAVICWEKAYKDPYIDQAFRGQIVDKGVQAADTAVRLKPDYREAIAYASLLYREKDKLETDPVLKEQWLAKADSYRQRAIALGEKAKKDKKT